MSTFDFVITNRLKKEMMSLSDAKGRRRSGMFAVEGDKCFGELVGHFRLRYIVATEMWAQAHPHAAEQYHCECAAASAALMRELSFLTTPSPVIAYFDIPEATPLPDDNILSDNLILALDRIQDPGNLGTILRTADWMGVHTVVASHDTADAFSPKVVQATMGALARVTVVYTDLAAFVNHAREITPVYGTFLDGENIYRQPLSRSGIVVMGNEGRGISPEVAACVTRRLYIPPYPGDANVESLNVATANAITLSQFRSRLQQ